MAYVDQFDHLVRADDRGKAIKNTRTIVVFDDGLVVCPVRVYGGAAGGIFGGLRRGGRTARSAPGRGDEQIRDSAQVIGSCAEFAPTWPRALPIPFAIVEKVVLTRPRQVSELAIYEQTADAASPTTSIYLGDLSADRIRSALGERLGDRLEIQIAG